MLITHGKVVIWGQPNKILDDHAIYIENGMIKEIGPTREFTARHPDPGPVDAGGQLIFPGNICAHTHFYGAFSRGLNIPGSPPGNFIEILRKLWWPLDKSLTYEDIRFSALVCLIDAIRHGTTLLFDHHASPNAIDGSLDVIEEAVAESGVRAVLAYEVSDRDGPEKAAEGISENVRFINKVMRDRNKQSQVAASFGLHASLSLSDGTLDKSAGSNPGKSFHIHAAEGKEDQTDSLAKSGMRVVTRLNAHRITGPNSILAHCVHVDDDEIKILSESKTWVTHQPRSNMNNGVGVAPIPAMEKAGVQIGLGNDGFSNAMWEEWKTAYLIHKVWQQDPREASGSDIIRIAVENNADLAEVFFPGMNLGRITVGAAADLIFVDYQAFTHLTGDNLPWHIIFGFQEDMITTTIVGGKLLMKDHALQTLDEEAIFSRARTLSANVWKRYEERMK